MSALPVEQPPSGDHHHSRATTSTRRARRATPVRQLFPNRNERLPDGDWTFPGGGERFSGDTLPPTALPPAALASTVLALPPRPGASRPSVAEMRLAAAADEAWLATVAKARFGPASAQDLALASAPTRSTARSTVRLTRRGRVVLAVLAALVLAGLFVAGATAAQASAPAAAHAGDTRVFVQPGDTLWSIAQRTAPGADPQSIVQDILSANHLSSATVTVGQRLWVPRR